MTQPDGVRDAEFVQSLGRGLAVIRAFDLDRPELTLSDVAKITGLTRAAARRFLHTLVALGYVRTNGRVFALRPQVLELGHPYLATLRLPDIARPHLTALAERVHASCSLAVLDGNEIVYVARAPVRQVMTVNISIGTRFPARATSMGRVLLAHADPAWLQDYLARVDMTALTPYTTTDRAALSAALEQARAREHCVVDQELEEGLRSIAVPVRGRGGAVVAAMNISTRSLGDPDALRAAMLPALQEAARLVGADVTAPA